MRPVRLRRLIAAALLWVGASPAHALCGEGVGSEDLTNECLLGFYAATADPAARAALDPVITARLMAAGHDRSIGLAGRAPQPKTQISLRPLLEYSRNLNGGELDSALVLGGLAFVFDPGVQRQAGWAFGAEFALSRRILMGDGKRLDLGLSAAALHAPEEDLTLARAQIAACPVWRLDRHWRLDGCLRAQHDERALSTDTAIQQGLGLTRFIRRRGGTGSTALRIGLDRYLAPNVDQRSLHLSVESHLPRDTVASLALGVGTGDPGQFVVKRSLSATLSGPVLGRSATLRFRRVEEGGAALLGIPREDRTDHVSLAIPIHRRVGLELGYTKRRSTIASFDESYPSIGLRLEGVRF